MNDPDKVVNCRLETEHCSCGHPLTDLAGVPGERAQVFELPRLRLEVTEYQREVKVCPGCQQVHRGRYPAGVSAGASYGANYQGLMSYLMQRQFIPFERLADLSHELLGHRPSEGSLYRMQRRLFERLAGVERAIRSSESVLASLQEADLIHVDETGCYLNGSNHWVQVVSTPRLTYYRFQGGGGRVAHQQIGILPSFSGRVVHDQYASYYDPGYSCEHVACNAHLRRGLLGVWEAKGESWALNLAELLVDAHLARRRQPLNAAQQRAVATAYVHLLEQGLALNPLPVRKAGEKGELSRSKAQNLLRLQKRKQEVLRFTRDPSVPFDNNQADPANPSLRDLRMVKLKQKISGGFRSLQRRTLWVGAQIFCRIRGYLSTLRKQGLDLLEALTCAFQGDPIMPDLARA